MNQYDNLSQSVQVYLEVHNSHIDSTTGSGNPLVTAIIAMAKALNLTVVAEGVETQEQACWLVENGCDVLQGFLYGKPVDAVCFVEANKKSPK